MGDQHIMLMPLLFVPLRLIIPDGLQLAKLVLVALISLSTLLTFVAGRRTAGWLGGLLAALLFCRLVARVRLWQAVVRDVPCPALPASAAALRSVGARRSVGRLLCLGLLGGSAIAHQAACRRRVRRISVVERLHPMARPPLVRRRFAGDSADRLSEPSCPSWRLSSTSTPRQAPSTASGTGL